MASKLGNTEAIGNEVATGGLRVEQVGPAKARGAKSGAGKGRSGRAKEESHEDGQSLGACIQISDVKE